ncbi:5-hydroxyisourate hydrolase [Iodidimonas nitroreducens]|uniref:5-hydroxyisourate hydrolase n=1 Tax=Iodidimonas nitroreducens TaxID=1236968 RepID=A0A5A7N7B3_9PROT|nr:hydroxyisourate hydrolase [Iodidimonas nitroreducens]GAK34307.1 5-hydroxyisourate hydrolase [alpha proteobacterium Q-1]GER03535.1 5-hydroxyisourate hydrolase [Iodidimonas nitroreducens]
MAGLTTHILDTTHGTPAAGVSIRLYARNDDGDALLLTTKTNSDGRCDQPLIAAEDLKIGRYRLEFDVASYFAGKAVDLPDPPFLDQVVINFGVNDAKAHYHVPLLVSPFGYSTYRGS